MHATGESATELAGAAVPQLTPWVRPPGGSTRDGAREGVEELKREVRVHVTLLLPLFLSLTIVAFATAGFVGYKWYRIALDQQQRWLAEIVDSRAHRIGEPIVVAPGGGTDPSARSAERQIRDAAAMFDALTRTGELMVAERRGDEIVFLGSRRVDGGRPEPIPWSSASGSPMQRALGGEIGTLIGTDYRGVRVLAAYHPVDGTRLGVVATIDMAEVRAPLVRTGAAAVIPGMFFLLLGAFLFLRLGPPMLERLADSEARLKAIVDSARDPILTFDATGTVRSCNRAATRMFGYGCEELVDRSLFSLLPERLRDDGQSRFASTVDHWDSGLEDAAFELAALRKDGTEIPFEMSVTPFRLAGQRYWSGILRDVSARHRFEEDLARLAMAIDQVGDAVMITDGVGTIQYVNPAFERITGYTLREAVGESARLIGGKTPPMGPPDELWSTIARGENWSGRFEQQRKDGALYKATATVSPVVDGAGAVANYVAVMRDVSQEARLEEQVRHAQKLEVVGQLAGGIAHDFNNLLTGISGYVELSLLSSRLESQVESDLQDVVTLVQHARDLTRRLLLFSSREASHPKPVMLGNLVAASLKMLTRMIGEDIRIEVVSDSDPRAIRADQGQIEQVLMNLVLNACDAMPEGGRLRIRTGAMRMREPQATALGIVSDTYAVLSVSDEGVGMEEAVRERVFEPFFTTKPSGKGTGLGLAMVYGIVTDHGGAIEVHSTPGAGATFSAYLPLLRDQGNAERAVQKQPARGGRGETILLVEDDRAVLEVLERMLERHGYTVLAASRPEQAERLHLLHGNDVALLLTDIVMPGYSGLTLYGKLAERDADLKVIFMSGHTEESGRLQEVRRAGAAFVQKPPSFDLLTAEIRAALDR